MAAVSASFVSWEGSKPSQLGQRRMLALPNLGGQVIACAWLAELTLRPRFVGITPPFVGEVKRVGVTLSPSLRDACWRSPPHPPFHAG